MAWQQQLSDKDGLMTMAWQCNGMTTMVWWPWPIRWCWLAQKWWPDSNGTMKTTRWRWLDYNGLLMTAWWQKPDNCGWPDNKGQMATCWQLQPNNVPLWQQLDDGLTTAWQQPDGSPRKTWSWRIHLSTYTYFWLRGVKLYNCKIKHNNLYL